MFALALGMSKAMVASNAEAERVFSRWKKLTTGSRATTLPQHVDDIMCVSEHARGGDNRSSFTERYPTHILRAGLEDRDANIAF